MNNSFEDKYVFACWQKITIEINIVKCWSCSENRALASDMNSPATGDRQVKRKRIERLIVEVLCQYVNSVSSLRLITDHVSAIPCVQPVPPIERNETILRTEMRKEKKDQCLSSALILPVRSHHQWSSMLWQWEKLLYFFNWIDFRLHRREGKHG